MYEPFRLGVALGRGVGQKYGQENKASRPARAGMQGRSTLEGVHTVPEALHPRWTISGGLAVREVKEGGSLAAYHDRTWAQDP